MLSPASRPVGPAALLFWGALAVAGCHERDASKAKPRPESAPTASAALAPGAPAAPSAAAPEPKRRPDVSRAATRLDAGRGPFVVDEPVDIAPSGPATPHESGVVMVDRQDKVVVARRGKFAAQARRAPTAVSPLARKREEFVPYARGPAVVGEFAYWVRKGQLVRARLDGSAQPEVLASDARNGTRVVGSRGLGLGALIAYVTVPDAQGALQAKLWLEGGKSLHLTPEGAGSSSVALATQKDGWTLLTLDGRSGMTPVHARRVTPEGGTARLGTDTVVWVGGSAQATTEVFAAATDDEVWAFVPIEQDATHFGLAQLEIGATPQMVNAVTFASYPNGLNTAPVAAASLCGKTTVVFAQPDSATPNAPQELFLATVGRDGLEAGEVVAKARSFADASLAAISGGGLLVYNAERRTWAVTLRCRDGAAAARP